MILVDIYIPAIDSTYDFMLDENTPIGQLMAEITGMIGKKVKESEQVETQNFLLCDMKSGTILKREKTLYTSGIADGGKLIFV